MQFFIRELEAAWEEARDTLAEFVGARGDDLVFVDNATARSRPLLLRTPDDRPNLLRQIRPPSCLEIEAGNLPAYDGDYRNCPRVCKGL